jgi:hypothetical protein
MYDAKDEEDVSELEEDDEKDVQGIPPTRHSYCVGNPMVHLWLQMACHSAGNGHTYSQMLRFHLVRSQESIL